MVATGALDDMPLGAGGLNVGGCARSAHVLLERLRPLAVLTEVPDMLQEHSSMAQEQGGAGPRYVMHPLVRRSQQAC